MELWVRSQDKETLMKVDRLDIDLSNGIYKIKADGFETTLAIYKTKERALEVLDEIQRKIENLYALENCSLEKNSCIEKRIVMDNFNIYEMPKD